MQAGPGADYFATRKWSFEWTFGGHSALMSFWHRPLHAMRRSCMPAPIYEPPFCVAVPAPRTGL